MENAKTQKQVVLCRQQLPTAWLFKTNDRRRKGIPDVLALVKGICFALECKEIEGDIGAALRADKRWALQREELFSLKRAGARVFLLVHRVGGIDFYSPDLELYATSRDLASFLLAESLK